MTPDTRWAYVGFDTSNYTTSAAAVVLDEHGRPEVIANCKCPLPVEPGARGLRQSDAVFAHTRNLPRVTRELREILTAHGCSVAAVAASATPRDAEGSYMPCFLSGLVAAEAFLSGARVMAGDRTPPVDADVGRVSHQSGHIMAALWSSGALADGVAAAPFLAFHVSGGTTEVVVATPRLSSETDGETAVSLGFDVTLVGGGADLHAGQVVDRVGVMLGLDFPCGPALEALAATNTTPLPPVRPTVREGICHLSGLENQAATLWKKTADPALVAAYTLTHIGKALRLMTDQIESARLLRGESPLPVVYAGGVMSNKLIRPLLTDGATVPLYFAEPAFSADNAAGVALLCLAAHGGLS